MALHGYAHVVDADSDELTWISVSRRNFVIASAFSKASSDGRFGTRKKGNRCTVGTSRPLGSCACVQTSLPLLEVVGDSLLTLDCHFVQVQTPHLASAFWVLFSAMQPMRATHPGSL